MVVVRSSCHSVKSRRLPRRIFQPATFAISNQTALVISRPAFQSHIEFPHIFILPSPSIDCAHQIVDMMIVAAAALLPFNFRLFMSSRCAGLMLNQCSQVQHAEVALS